jgi:hypothetical protein
MSGGVLAWLAAPAGLLAILIAAQLAPIPVLRPRQFAMATGRYGLAPHRRGA